MSKCPCFFWWELFVSGVMIVCSEPAAGFGAACGHCRQGGLAVFDAGAPAMGWSFRRRRAVEQMRGRVEPGWASVLVT